MPTATFTAPSTGPAKRKGRSTATLQKLYHRAARGFLLRDFPLVQTLNESAFALLAPPESEQGDELSPWRSKWDLLRITLETTAHAETSSSGPPAALIGTAFARSLALFSPLQQHTAANVPSAVIITLVYASLKLDAPDAGRAVIEQWFAARQLQHPLLEDEGGGYTKAVEAYVLHLLPRLEQWEYAAEFLAYESELPVDVRDGLRASLQALHAQAIAARLPPPPPSPVSAILVEERRPYSPTPSSSSSSSSLSSTASMGTVVPATPRPRSNLSKPTLTHSRSHSSSSATATPRASAAIPLPLVHSPPRTHSVPQRLFRPPVKTKPPTTYAVLRASLAPYLDVRLAVSLTTFLLLLVLPLLVRRRRARLTSTPTPPTGSGSATSGNVATADAVRRRLLAASASKNVIAQAWRVLVDTVRMGGSGLV
ncbi:hypothetical protein DFH07DRAFT_833774 [Mycena maculata]|uniref:Uncharacterized protein n=1 Tax=Mycena maculata TaxID=230809 RepID=A0AAD7IME7_9AGAR|nr:hypothetical protein DFH07DRAFT_833774 [Mycena maculata]